MGNVDSRLKVLETAIRRRQLNQGAQMDPLSRSLLEAENEILGLDALGRTAFLVELNRTDDPEGSGSLDLTPADIDRMIAACREGRRFLW